MPLVTRQANQGNLFNTLTEPPDWLEGDIWSDTTDEVVKYNKSGTATLIGTVVGPEQAMTPVTVDGSGTAGADRLWLSNEFTLPTTDEFYFITACESDNGATISGNVVLGACQVDAVPPVGTGIKLVAWTPLTAQAGANAKQKINVQYSQLIKGGTKLVGFLCEDDGTSEWDFDTVSSGNIRKDGYGSKDPMMPVSQIAWTASTAQFYVKVYFKGITF